MDTLYEQYTSDENDALAAKIHEVARKYVEEENTAVEALCLAYLVQVGDELIQDWTLVRQDGGLTGVTRWYLERKDPFRAVTVGMYRQG